MTVICLSFLNTVVYASSNPTVSEGTYDYDESTNTYTLTNDITLSSTWTISDNTIIDLNGYTIKTTTNYNGRTISISSGTTLTINDSVGTGVVTNSYNKDNKEAIYNEGTVIINGGTFSGGFNTVKNDENGTDVYGTLIITGGTFNGTYILDGAIQSGSITPTAIFIGGTYSYITAFLADYDNDFGTVSEDTITIIAGGTYSSTDVIPEYDATVYMLLDNEDGTYTVVLISDYDGYVITENEDGSVTVSEATTGDVIILLGSILVIAIAGLTVTLIVRKKANK